jgi:hypothetical protein
MAFKPSSLPLRKKNPPQQTFNRWRFGTSAFQKVQNIIPLLCRRTLLWSSLGANQRAIHCSGGEEDIRLNKLRLPNLGVRTESLIRYTTSPEHISSARYTRGDQSLGKKSLKIPKKIHMIYGLLTQDHVLWGHRGGYPRSVFSPKDILCTDSRANASISVNSPRA